MVFVKLIGSDREVKAGRAFKTRTGKRMHNFQNRTPKNYNTVNPKLNKHGNTFFSKTNTKLVHTSRPKMVKDSCNDLPICTVGTKIQVWKGIARKTSGGLKRVDLIRNRHGRIVSRKASRAAKRKFENNSELREAFKKNRAKRQRKK